MVAIINFFTVVTFSAGSGKRLRPKTYLEPKLLVKVGRKTIFDFTVRFFIESFLCKKCYIVFRERRRRYLSILKKFTCVELVKNFFPPESHCASSLYSVYKKLDGGVLFFNSDLILNKPNLNYILKEISNTKLSLIFGINNSSVEPDCDLQRAKISKKGRVVSWSMELNDFDSYITGPFYLCGKDVKLMKGLLDKRHKNDVINLPCFTFFSELIDEVEINFREINAFGFAEIDNLQDLNLSLYKKWVQ